MKIKPFIFALLALLTASCTRDINVPEPAAAKERGTVIINAAIPQQTRVAYDDATLKLAWENNDQLLLAGFDNNGAYQGSATFTYTGSGNQFSGEAVTGATIYKAYYPAAATTLDANGNPLPFAATFWKQTQAGDNTTAHLGDKLIMSDEAPNAIDESFTLTLKSDIIKFVLTNVPAEVGALKKLIWTVKTAKGVTRSAILDVTGVTFSSSATAFTAYLAFDPAVTNIAANGKVKIKLIGDRTYEWVATVAAGKSYTAGNRYTATVNGNWETPGTTSFRFTVNTASTKSIDIKQHYSSSTNPANLTIDWGDGTANTTIEQGASLPWIMASHTYVNAGDYTITVTSDQAEPSLKQMPQISFKYNRQLTSVLDPFPNMEATKFEDCFFHSEGLTSIPDELFKNNTKVTNFRGCFSDCYSLTSIPAGLFNNNTQATDFGGCFYYCYNLTSIPAGLFNNNTQVTSFFGCFVDCQRLTSIPAGLFDNNTQATAFSNCFSDCYSLTSIPAGLFDNNTQVTSFNGCFSSCYSLTSIPAGLFNNNTQATDFGGCFSSCYSLTSIPAGLFDNNTQVKSFGGCFSDCTGLTSIPSGLFDNNTQVIDLGCFGGCKSLTSIPAGLFDNNTQVTSFIECFRGCESLTSIPAGLFDNNTQVTHFRGCFVDCKNLTNIPAGLFDNNTQVTDFFRCFDGCKSLTSIPAGLFDNNTQVTSFWGCFRGCESLTSIPTGLFDNNTQVTTFYGCFSDCLGLTSIPSGLFDNNTQVTSFQYCFRSCKSLTSIPAGLFDHNVLVTIFESCFSSCKSLTSIPAGLFDNNTQVTNFARCFGDCESLTNVPAGLFNNNTLATNFSYCFINCFNLQLTANIFPDPVANPNFFAGRAMYFSWCFVSAGKNLSTPGTAPELWKFSGSNTWSVTGCFTGANVSNYDVIPNNWK
ncbi:MAG: hypothetical protein ACOX19_05970 [Fermentimonas sp.]|jgi:hypothetical protein